MLCGEIVQQATQLFAPRVRAAHPAPEIASTPQADSTLTECELEVLQAIGEAIFCLQVS